MTDEEVIRIAQGLITDFKCDSEMMVDFCNTVIKKFEQQTSCDCVSRNTLKRAVSELTYWHPTADGRLEIGGAFDNTVYKVEDVWRLTRELSSVTPKSSCVACREQVLKHLEKEDWADTVNCVMNMPFMKGESEE